MTEKFRITHEEGVVILRETYEPGLAVLSEALLEKKRNGLRVSGWSKFDPDTGKTESGGFFWGEESGAEEKSGVCRQDLTSMV